MPDPDAASGYGQHLPVGTRLHEFELLGLVGEGGFGIVYLAKDHSLQRRVALKEYMPLALAARGDEGRVRVQSLRHEEAFDAGLRSFVNEARLLASFDHPSLVKVYRFWEANGTAYMVMPFYEGQSRKRGPGGPRAGAASRWGAVSRRAWPSRCCSVPRCLRWWRRGPAVAARLQRRRTRGPPPAAGAAVRQPERHRLPRHHTRLRPAAGPEAAGRRGRRAGRLTGRNSSVRRQWPGACATPASARCWTTAAAGSATPTGPRCVTLLARCTKAATSATGSRSRPIPGPPDGGVAGEP